jgi:hypothetical protein
MYQEQVLSAAIVERAILSCLTNLIGFLHFSFPSESQCKFEEDIQPYGEGQSSVV